MTRPLFVIAVCAAAGLAQEVALIPLPREFHIGALVPTPHGIAVSAPEGDAEDRFSAEDLIAGMAARGAPSHSGAAGDVKIVLLRESSRKASAILSARRLAFSLAMHDEGYGIATEGDAVYDIGATAAGVY